MQSMNETEQMQDLYKLLKDVEVKRIQEMYKHYKRATKSMFVAAMVNMICVLTVVIVRIYYPSRNPLFTLFAIFINFATMIFNLYLSHKYARLAEAYANMSLNLSRDSVMKS